MGMGDAHHREPLPRPISSLATGEEAPSIQAPRRSAGVSAAVGPRIGGQPDQGDAATLGLSPLAGAHTNVRAEGASTKPCLLGWPGLHTCGQRAAQRLWNPGDDGPAQGQVWALCWLSPSWEPGPGPGLDRKSWFPPKPENMRLWPRAPGRAFQGLRAGRVASIASCLQPARPRSVLSRVLPRGPPASPPAAWPRSHPPA